MGSLISKPVPQAAAPPVGHRPPGKEPVLDEKADACTLHERRYRPHPQLTFAETSEYSRICCATQLTTVAIAPDSFFGQLRGLYAATVLKTQLDQLRKQGSYDAYELKWKPVYKVRRTKGAKCQVSPGDLLRPASH